MAVILQLGTYRKQARAEHPSISPDDADRIVAHVLSLPKLDLFLNDSRPVSSDEQLSISAMLRRRESGEPLQYILGYAHFRDLKLSVGQGVLIPRPETEMLVDIALQHIAPDSRALDLGTGSGAIALAIAVEMPQCSVTAVDISKHALSFASANFARYRAGNILFYEGDLFKALPPGCGDFDIITANLPYVSEEIYPGLDREVRDFEPAAALLSGKDGLDLITRAAGEARPFLKPNGHLILEFSPEQESQITRILANSDYACIRIHHDLNSRARFASAVKANDKGMR